MAKLKQIRTDPTREIDGVWVEWEMGVELKVARAGNRHFDDMMQKLSEPHLKGIREKSLPEGKAEEILKECVAATILVGWRGIENEDDTALEYSREASLELLQDEGLRDLYKFVLVTSNEAARYRREADDEAAKN